MGIKHTLFGGLTATPRTSIVGLYPRVVAAKGGRTVDLASYQGKVVLIVNTASQCGFTKQYDDLEALYQRYRDKGFVILGFPSNDFGGQEPGSDTDIEEFCRVNFGVTFELFPKDHVKGDNAQPLFKALTSEGPADLRGGVRWNFEKFLLDRSGRLVGRWRSWVKPSWGGLRKAIEKELESCG
jgi:glutathione peroxidase